MPLSGPDAFVGDVRRRQFRGDHLFRIEAFDRAVDDPLGAKILGTVDAERKFGDSLAVVDHFLGQEILGPEAEIAAIVATNIHRRRADEGRDEAIGGIVVDFRRRSDLPHAAVVDDGDAVAHAHRLDLVVGHVDRGDADPLLELLDLLSCRGAQLGVEVGQRLVEQQRGRLAHQRARERDALAFAAGELTRPPVEQMADAEQLRRPLDLLFDFGARARPGCAAERRCCCARVKCG